MHTTVHNIARNAVADILPITPQCKYIYVVVFVIGKNMKQAVKYSAVGAAVGGSSVRAG